MTAVIYPAASAHRAWMADAACRGCDPALFLPEKGDSNSVRQARDVCRRCPVTAPCLDYAIANHELGVWAGTTERERRRLRRAWRWRQVQP